MLWCCGVVVGRVGGATYLSGAVIRRDGVIHAGPHREGGRCDDLTPLLVEAADLREGAIVRPIRRHELSCHGHRLGRIDGKLRPGAPESLVLQSERLEVATVLVAHALEALGAVAALRTRGPAASPSDPRDDNKGGQRHHQTHGMITKGGVLKVSATGGQGNAAHVGALASGLVLHVARVRRHRRRDRVCLPDIHLNAARAVPAQGERGRG